MTSRDFVFWLQGYFEILAPALNDASLSSAQVKVIREHLALVFKHEAEKANPPVVAPAAGAVPMGKSGWTTVTTPSGHTEPTFIC